MSTAIVPGWLPRYVLLGLSIVGWGLAVRALVVGVSATAASLDTPIGGLGLDSDAYWLAGSRYLHGEAIYRATTIAEVGAYFYAPPFAQAWAPLSLLPIWFTDWSWRLLGLLSIRYMAGSWLLTGVWMMFPPTIVELLAGNVTFPVAALTVAGLRGRAEGVIPAAIVKFNALAVVPYIWFCQPKARRGLLVGAVGAATIVLLSVLTAPAVWSDYVDELHGQAALTLEGSPIIRLLPAAGMDYLVRLALAAVLAVASIRMRSAFLASFIAIPTIREPRLAILLALPTLTGDAWLKRFLEVGGRPAPSGAAAP
jgi:hypothetical protein